MPALLLLPVQAMVLATLVIGIVLWRRGHGLRKRQSLVAGIGMTVLAAPLFALLTWAVANDMATEWNPAIVSNDDIRGAWSNGVETLVLGDGADATYTSPLSTLHGQWYREDWNLSLAGPGLDREMHFYRKWGTLRLLANNGKDDPDTWDSNAGWRRR